jgi:alpha-glucosidase
VANTAVDVLKAIPAVWDQTIILPGSEPGKIAAAARKSGNAWFVGILNGATATTMNLSLSFLGTGTWQKIQLGDAAQAGAWDRQTGTATAADSISVKLSSRGGFVAWFKQ